MSLKLITSKKSQKQRGLYTKMPKQNRIIARHIKGESNRKIAREEAMDRFTVGRVLAKEEVILKMAQLQSDLLCMGDDMVDAIRRSVKSDDERIAAMVALKGLEGIGILDKRGLLGVIQDEANRSPLIWDEEVLKRLWGRVPPELRRGNKKSKA